MVIITLTFYEASRNYKQHIWLLMPWNAKKPTFIYRQFWAFRGLPGLSPRTIYWGLRLWPHGRTSVLRPLMRCPPCRQTQAMLLSPTDADTNPNHTNHHHHHVYAPAQSMAVLTYCFHVPRSWARRQAVNRPIQTLLTRILNPNFHYFCMHSMPFTTRNELPANDIILLRICE